MKQFMKLMIIVMVTILCQSYMHAQQEGVTGFTVVKMGVGTGMENRELVGEAETFPVETEKVYCSLAVKDISVDTTVTFVWSLDGKELNRTTVSLKQGSRWRTWAQKAIYNKKGDWRVDLQDSTGNVVHSVSFKIE